MAVIPALVTLLAVFLFCLIMAAFGYELLRQIQVSSDCKVEHFLYSIAAGVTCFELILFFIQMTGRIRFGLYALLVLMVLAGARSYPQIIKNLKEIIIGIVRNSWQERLFAGITAIVASAEGLAAMAPLTGSDALHYHFPAPRFVLESGLHPNFFLSHSFFTGQSHLLILAGLALGSEKLAMGFLYAGGVLAAAAASCLTRRWASSTAAWMVALTFLLTPVVFWQMSSAGAPDLWMSFFTCSAVLVIAPPSRISALPQAIFAGALAGAIAGAKYTGCIVAASILIAFFNETRSVLLSFRFLFSATVVGIWPYLRNAVWTGDPMFPFLSPWFLPGRINAFTFASYRADTGATGEHHFLSLLKFPFFAGLDPLHIGFWQFFCPLVFAFLIPLVLVARQNFALWRAPLTVWIFSGIAIGWSSYTTRFLLPVYSIALSISFAAVFQLDASRYKVVRKISIASAACFILFGGAGLIFYDRAAIQAAAGLTPREEYLRAHAPDYEISEFINRSLTGNPGKTLLFLRHVYYVQIPFLYGDPAASWAIDPKRFQDPQEWRNLFRSQDIRWVVRSPAYPASIRAALTHLEDTGELVPVANAAVSSFKGFKIADQRESLTAVILQVKDSSDK